MRKMKKKLDIESQNVIAVILYFTVILYRIGSECLLQRKIQYMKWQKTLGRGEHQRTEKTESIDSVHLAGMLPVC